MRHREQTLIHTRKEFLTKIEQYRLFGAIVLFQRNTFLASTTSRNDRERGFILRPATQELNDINVN